MSTLDGRTFLFCKCKTVGSIYLLGKNSRKQYDRSSVIVRDVGLTYLAPRNKLSTCKAETPLENQICDGKRLASTQGSAATAPMISTEVFGRPSSSSHTTRVRNEERKDDLSGNRKGGESLSW